MPKRLTDEIVRAAIEGFTVQKAHLNQRIAELRAMLNVSSPESPAALEPAPGKRRKMSAIARRRIAAAQSTKRRTLA